MYRKKIFTLTDAMLGGGVDQIVAQAKHEAAAKLGPEIADYNAQSNALLNQETKPSPEADTVKTRAVADLNATCDTAVAKLASCQSEIGEAGRYERLFKYQHNQTRDVQEPDRALAATCLAGMTLTEAAATGAFYYNGGFVSGIAEAAVFGLAIAGTTTLLAAGVGGGFCGRYWNYGLHARTPTSDMQAKRRMGRVGALLTGASIAGILAVSGLVRSTGEPEALSFTLENFQAAASNAYSVMLWFTGAGFAILSWRTALAAFDDPYPGYLPACKASVTARQAFQITVDDANDTLDGIHEDALDQLAEFADDVVDDKKDATAEFDNLSLRHQELLGMIDLEESRVIALASEFQGTQHILGGGGSTSKTPRPVSIDLDHLRRRLPAPSRPTIDPGPDFEGSHKDAVNAVTDAYRSALERISEARVGSQSPQT